MPRPTPAERVMPIDWSTRPSSSMAMHRLVNAPPSPASSEPPNSSGTTRPNRPEVTHARHEVGREVVRRGPTGRRAARRPRSRTRAPPCGSPRGPCSARTSALLRAGVPRPGSRGAAAVIVLDVDVNVKQYSPVCQPPPRMPGAPRRCRRPVAADEPRPHLVDRAGGGRVRGHPPHGAALRGARPDLPRAARHDPGLPPPRPHPARPSSCAASGSASRSRRSARSSTSTTCRAGGAASSSTCSARSTSAATDLEQRRRDLDAALSELAEFERRCRVRPRPAGLTASAARPRGHGRRPVAAGESPRGVAPTAGPAPRLEVPALPSPGRRSEGDGGDEGSSTRSRHGLVTGSAVGDGQAGRPRGSSPGCPAVPLLVLS